MSENITSTFCALILTARPLEYREVCTHVDALCSEEESPGGATYQQGIFTANGHSWKIGLVKTSTMDLGRGLEVERAINYFKPDVIFFVGVAIGLKGAAQVGDVVVATKVYDYEADQSATAFQPGPAVVYSAYSLVQIAQTEARKKDWLKLIAPSYGQKLRVFVAPIVAGEDVTYSTGSYNDLQESYRDAVAIEMKGSKFLQALQAYYHRRDTLIIRGITGSVGDGSEPSMDTLKLAARHASTFAFSLLATMGSTSYQNRRGIPSPSPSLAPELREANPVKSIKIFYSYAREDEEFVKNLQLRLITLKHLGLIDDLYAGRITPGENRQDQVERHLNSADIILLLISPAFMNAEDLYRTRTLEKRQRANETIVIPILLHPTEGWQYLAPGNLLSIPRNGNAISEFSNPNTALAEIAREIRSIVEKLRSIRST